MIARIGKLSMSACVLMLISGCYAVFCGFSANAAANELADDDRDGVINVRDRCPATPAALQVNSVGCEQLAFNVEKILLNIPFKHGSAYIHPRYHVTIKAVADQLKQYPYAKLTLEGHASAKGSKGVNQAMSMERAKRVAGVLIDKYVIAATRIKVKVALVQSNTTQDHKDESSGRQVVAYIKRHKLASHLDYLN